MSDFWFRALTDQRHADYLRETEHEELVAEAKQYAAGQHPASPSGAATTRDPRRHRWQLAWPHLPSHLSPPHAHPLGRGA
jgi:hypothetical protein